ncbi:MAG: photosystem II reaction center protein T [bacterium]
MSKHVLPFLIFSFSIICIGIISIFYRLYWVSYLFIIIGSILLVFFTIFFRDPERRILKDDDAVLSPADGTIIACDRVENEKFVGDCYKIRIFMSIFDVHIVRMPVEGIIEDVRRYRGRFKLAFKESASKENTRVAVLINSKKGLIKMHLITGIIARRIVFNGNPGEKWSQGDRIGIIKFGSAVEIFIPDRIELNVFKGLKVKAGESVLGRWKREE